MGKFLQFHPEVQKLNTVVEMSAIKDLLLNFELEFKKLCNGPMHLVGGYVVIQFICCCGSNAGAFY